MIHKEREKKKRSKENGLIMASVFDVVGESFEKLGVLSFIDGS